MAFTVAQGTFDVLRRRHGQFLAYDPARQHFYATVAHDDAQDAQVAEALNTHLSAISQNSNIGDAQTEQAHILQQCAARFLKTQMRQHEGLQKGLSACRGSTHLMNLTLLDRLIVSVRFKAYSAEQLTGLALPDIRAAYKTEAARESLSKWIAEPTHRAMKERAREIRLKRDYVPKHPEHVNERVIDSTEGAKAFALHPDQVDFVKDHFLEKRVGTRANHRILVDPQSKNLGVLFDGQARAVRDIAQNYISENHRLYVRGPDGQKGARISYKDQVGLTECDGTRTEKEDPEHFTQTVPLFEQKASRKHQDHRLEIWTVIKHEGDQHNHSWIGLKTPDGKVRRFGFFWKEGEERPWLQLLEPATGAFEADGDKYDHMRLEPWTMRTSTVITSAQYDRALAFVLKKQNEMMAAAQKPGDASSDEPKEGVESPKFELINQNCTDFANDVLQEALGFKVPVGCSLLDIYLDTDLKNNFFVKYVPPVRLAVFALSVIFSVLRNLCMLMLGATISGDKPVFNSFWDIFNPWAGRASHPVMMRRWQEKVERLRNRQLNEVLEHYEGVIDDNSARSPQLNVAKARRIHEIKTNLPQDAIPRTRSVWWQIADLFFSMSSDETVLPIP